MQKMTATFAARGSDQLPTKNVSLRSFSAYFLRLGAIGFGGPIALAGYMQRDLVDTRRWVTREDYVEGLAFAQLAPGPLAAQLAMYLGYVRAGFIGATLVGVAFIAPSFFMVLALAAAYVKYGGLGWVQAVFYGIGAAVIAIILRSAFKLAKLTLRDDKLLWLIFVVLAASTAVTGREVIWLFLLAGLVAFVVKSKPSMLKLSARALLLPTLVGSTQMLGKHQVTVQLLAFFSKAGLFVFGSGLAIVPFLYGGVVEQHHWLTDRQFLDAVAVAMITPGPVVITAAFIGFLVARFTGAIAAAAGVFLPVYLLVVGISPSFQRISKNPQLRTAVEGVTAAATGAIAGAVFVLGRRAIYDIPTALIAVATLLIIFRWKIPEPLIIGAAGVAGLIAYHV